MKLSILVVAILFITGCGAGNSQENKSDIIGSELSGIMEINKIYAMHPNDKVMKKTDDAIIQITHKNESSDSNIKLLSGEAEIIRNN